MGVQAPLQNTSTQPIVAVIGTTGVGKSDFAVELALAFEAKHAQGSQAESIQTAVSSESQLGSDVKARVEPNGERVRPIEGSGQALVLSADSMQLYRGLPLITNQLTPDEMRGVKHWGVGMVEPLSGDGSWEVGRWCLEAGRELANARARAPDVPLLPIVCGGTHYYIQHFLFPPTQLSLDRSREDKRPVGGTSGKSKSNRTKWSPPCPLSDLEARGALDEAKMSGRMGVLGEEDEGMRLLETFYLPAPTWPTGVASTSGSSSVAASTSPSALSDPQLLALHRLLNAVDPAEAGRWHWRDGRKVRRGIERWWERQAAGSNPSLGDAAPLEPEPATSPDDGDQQAEEAAGPAGERKRMLIFWVYDSLDRLGPRLDARVDRMVERGLLDEVRKIRRRIKEVYGSEEAVDHEEGIFQSIGFKEFASIPSDELDPSDPRFAACLDRMKLSTRQYAKSQLKWIKKQLLPAVAAARRRCGGQADVLVYVVPGGEAGRGMGPELLRRFLAGETMPDPMTTGHSDAATLLQVLYAEKSKQGDTELAGHVPDIAERQTLNARMDCPICSTSDGFPLSVLRSEWPIHERSKHHQRAVRVRELAAKGPDPYAEVRAEAARRKAEREKKRSEDDS